MNIKQAKDELKNTVQAYLKKDAFGFYEIPEVSKRPVLLMGPPGIGKTAVMEQVAAECKIALVAYTITHHTRQSAVGLPFIEKQCYDGTQYTVTEYTMSEIIASVYKKIEETGRREGILFIDEINCVSETLAPTMLQFLQKKTFGSHKVPDGWILAAAGNPPEYNKSVREFDIVTLDRVRMLEIKEDFQVWKEYAYSRQVHGAILTYLEIKKENFYQIERTAGNTWFVTARGWEDLSRLIYVYEELNLPITVQVAEQYLQHPEIARDFAVYYELYEKYKRDYRIPEILNGTIETQAGEKLREASFDERLGVTGLLSAALSGTFSELYYQTKTLDALYEVLKKLKEHWEATGWKDTEVQKLLAVQKEEKKADLIRQKAAGGLEREEEEAILRMLNRLDDFMDLLKKEGICDSTAAFSKLKEQFNADREETEVFAAEASKKLESVFDFLETTFGESQELVIFLTDLTINRFSMRFLLDYGCERYDKYSKSLLLHERKRELLEEIRDWEKNKNVVL